MQNVNTTVNEATQKPKHLTILGEFSKYGKLATFTDGRNLHPLAPETNRADVSDENAFVTSRNLLKTLRNISYSLNAAMAYPIVEQRATTLYRESSQHIYNIHKSASTAQVTLRALQMSHKPASSSNDFQPSLYGLSTPYLRSQLSRFVIASLEKWAAATNLDFFLDDPHSSALDPPIPFPSSSGNTISAMSNLVPGQTKKIVTSLTKEQLLVDLEFEKHHFADDPRIDLMNNKHIIPISLHQVKISFGEKEEQSGSSGHPEGSLCLLLEERTRGFLRDLGCAPNVDWSQVDPVKVEKSAAELRKVLEEINWIVDTVKREAEVNSTKESETWDCIQSIADKASKVLQIEAKLMETDNNSGPVSVDTFALRSSGFHFPFLHSFSLSFLLYLPPLAYLTLLRSYSQQESKDTSENSNYPSDIPTSWTRKLLIDGPARERLQIPIATLAYDPNLKPPPSHTSSAMDIEGGQSITREHIASQLEDTMEWNNAAEYTFPTFLSSTPSSEAQGGRGVWTLSFSLGKAGQPFILSQSRMKRVAAAIHQEMALQIMPGLDILTLGAGAVAIGPSWLDLTLEPRTIQPSRVYTSRYRPSTDAQRQMQNVELVNTLTAVVEPGLALGKIPVKTLREAYDVMAIVKEQVWLNSLLQGAGFKPGYGSEDIGAGTDTTAGGGDPSNVNQALNEEEAKAMYAALLSGSYAPARLRVTYEILVDDRTGVRVSFPLSDTRVTVEVVLDVVHSLRGMTVIVNGERQEGMEEVVRRGGLLVLVLAVRSLLMKT
ncbi:hypothetical protein CPB86DRAFT_811200 [Serendipita vermifera]|nr:hypothetical protein CPB86DRAFT_811200 [Serendipita vermifera]